MSNCQYCDKELVYGNCLTCDTQGAAMTNETNLPDYDDHLVETFGPLPEDTEWDAGTQDDNLEEFPSPYEEGHFHGTIRDFEELMRDYGVQRIIENMDEESVTSLMEYFDE